MVLIEQLPSFVNEGYLYRAGDDFFLVYTGASGRGWDVCPTERDESRRSWLFRPPIVTGAPSHEIAVTRANEVRRAR